MKFERNALLLVLFFVLSMFHSVASASRASIDTDYMTIPRIDVDGYGALELGFRLVFEGEYLFVLDSATEASLSVSNSGVYDPEIGIINIDEVELESGDIYALQLGLLSQSDRVEFRILDAVLLESWQPLDEMPPSGEEDPVTEEEDSNNDDPEAGMKAGEDYTQAIALYSEQCSSCHSDDGTGTQAGSSLVSCLNCDSPSILSAYIEDTMPFGQSYKCDSDCADLLADYILSVLNPDNTMGEPEPLDPEPEPESTPPNEEDSQPEPETPDEEEPGSEAEVIEIDPQALTLYLEQCSSCHGDDGAGTIAGASLVDCLNCDSGSILSSYIADAMPLGDPTSCDDACAELLAQYILTAFNSDSADSDSENPNPEQPLNENDSPEPATPGGEDPQESEDNAQILIQEAIFAEQCSSCHGDSGDGIWSLIDCKNCTNPSMLSTYIANTMPMGQSARCDSDCADQMAAYIIDTLNSDSEEEVSEEEVSVEDLPAAALYNEQCSDCHGVTGAGTELGGSLLDCKNCGRLSVLSTYIAYNMPLGQADRCDNACAALLANYILETLNPKDEVEIPSPEEPPTEPVPPAEEDPKPEAGDGEGNPAEESEASSEDPELSEEDLRAAALYTEQCSSCHGVTGAGTVIAGSLLACENCGDVTVLSTYIATTMPLGQSDRCDADCAALLANYILETLNTEDVVEIPTPEEPPTEPEPPGDEDPQPEPEEGEENPEGESDVGEEDPAEETGPSEEEIRAAALYGEQCSGCHGVTGAGTAIGSSLLACANCASPSVLSNYIANTMPLGNPERCDSECAALLADYILESLSSDNTELSSETVEFLQQLENTSTLRKAAQQLASRLPTLDELQQASTTSGLEEAIFGLMDDPAFYLRLSEMFNDYLLTDKYHSQNGAEPAINRLHQDDYPNRKWWIPPNDAPREDNWREMQRYSNDAVAREPLELIKYVVEQGRPFTEILTADYIMMNPFSARSYGVENLQFNNPNDPNEFVPVRQDGIPHAGILTSPMFLNRYPTTPTNRNRARARVVFDLFLDTDILAIDGARPGVSDDLTEDNPTMNNPDCSVCHSKIDPVASAFQNWDYQGRFQTERLLRNGWHEDMRPAGFNGEVMPVPGNEDNSLQWLAAMIADDPKFPQAVTRVLVRGLTGKEPLQAPVSGEGSPEAFLAERYLLNSMQESFVANNFDLRTLILEVLTSSYWRADGLSSAANPFSFATTGSNYLLPPEQLDRKILTLLGFEWRNTLDSYHRDTDRSSTSNLNNRFHQIYGGINSDDVTTRLTAPNGMMGAMQLRMANELACYAAPHDFWLPADERKLFLFLDGPDSPYDDEGNIDQATMNLIRENISYLHEYLLGEQYGYGAAELQITEQLFMDVLNRGQQKILDSGNSRSSMRLHSDCDRTTDFDGNYLPNAEEGNLSLTEDPEYVIRAWMAVLAYLLSDYKFLYQ